MLEWMCARARACELRLCGVFHMKLATSCSTMIRTHAYSRVAAVSVAAALLPNPFQELVGTRCIRYHDLCLSQTKRNRQSAANCPL